MLAGIESTLLHSSMERGIERGRGGKGGKKKDVDGIPHNPESEDVSSLLNLRRSDLHSP